MGKRQAVLYQSSPWSSVGPGPCGERGGWGTRGSPSRESGGGQEGEQSPGQTGPRGVRGSRVHSPRGSEIWAGPGRRSQSLVCPERKHSAQRGLGKRPRPRELSLGAGPGAGRLGAGLRTEVGRGTRGSPIWGHWNPPWGPWNPRWGPCGGKPSRGALCTPTCTHMNGHPQTLPFGSLMTGSPYPASPPLPGADRGHGNG